MIYVTFGSQTGNSEEIAKRISREIKDKFKDTNVELIVMNKFLSTLQKFPEDKSKKNIVIAVCSTTGSGDPPNNSENFVRWIKRKTHASDTLSNVYFTLLGLGDSNYTKYQFVPKLIDESLCKIGAHKFFPRGEADDAYGLEIVVEPWIEELYPVLDKLLVELNESKENTEISFNTNIEFPKENQKDKQQNLLETNTIKINTSTTYLNGKVLSKSLISGSKSLREIYSLKINIDPSERELNYLNYTPGAHLSIIPPESEDRLKIINSVLTINTSDKYLIIDKTHHFNLFSDFYEKYLHFKKLIQKGYLTNEEVLKYVIDFDSVLKKSQMENIKIVLKSKLNNENEVLNKFENLFSKYTEMILKNRITLFDIINSLALYKIKLNFSLQELVESFAIKYPRSYSLVSFGYQKDSNPLEIVFSVCDDRIIRKFSNNDNIPLGFKSGEFYYKGQTSNFLKNCKDNDLIFISDIGSCFQFPLQKFLLGNLPIIYICNGTGITPCISFIKQLLTLKDKLNKSTIGELMILTGFRSASGDRKETVYEDYINYSIENLNDSLGKEAITYLRCTSNSSENEEEEIGIWRNCRINTKYVQDLIIEHDEQIYEKLVTKNGYLMVCGDIEKLYNECMSNIMSIVMKKDGFEREHWDKYVEDMKVNGRLIIEKWM